MDLKIYKLTAKSDLYKTNYTIRAQNLQEASKQAKIKFAKSYKVFGDSVKIGIQENDLANHIDTLEKWKDGNALILRGANHTFCSGFDLLASKRYFRPQFPIVAMSTKLLKNWS